MTKISIIGSGTVGTIIGSGFSEVGYSVTFYDIDPKFVKLKLFKKVKILVSSKFLYESYKKNVFKFILPFFRFVNS